MRRLSAALLAFALILFMGWTITAVAFQADRLLWPVVGAALGVAVVVGAVGRRDLRLGWSALTVCLAAIVLWWSAIVPRQDRVWAPDVAYSVTAEIKAFSAAFPMVEITLLVQTLEATYASLGEGQADLALVVVPMPDLLEGLESRLHGRMGFVLVASPDHPLAQSTKPLRQEDLRDHTQLLLSTGETSGTKDHSVHAVNRWRVTGLGLRHRLLLAGVGWSSMPRHLVAEDLRAGRLTSLTVDKASVAELPPDLPLMVVHQRSRPLGPAARWLMDRLTDQRESSTEV